MQDIQNLYQAPSVPVEVKSSEQYQQLVSPYGPMKDHSKLAMACKSLLGIFAIGSIFSMAMWMKLRLDIINGDYSLLLNDGPLMKIFIFSGMAMVVSMLSLVPLFCIWTNRSMKNAWCIPCGQGTPKMKPGWAVGWYFVPIAHLWMPLMGMREIWKRTFRGERSKLSLYLWWGAWVHCFIRVFDAAVASVFSTDLVLSGGYTLPVLGNLINGGSAILLLYIISQITKNQVEYYDKCSRVAIENDGSAS